MQIKSVCFVTNAQNAQAVCAVADAVDALHTRGYECCAQPELITLLQNRCALSVQGSRPDLILAFGGDGTILRACSFASALDVPVLGVNFGRVGFLSETTSADLLAAMDAIEADNYSLDERMMLECRLNNGAEYTCINDVMLYKKTFSGVAEIDVSIDGIDAGSVFCDGIIVSTPTGATGYSISAGGPVIAPGVEASIITPICPHTLCFRPIIASKSAKIRLSVKTGGKLAVDGVYIDEVKPGDAISVGESHRHVSFVRLARRNVYSLIRDKLS